MARLSVLAIVGGALLLGGCAGVKVVPGRVDPLKSVAIVGFAADVNLGAGETKGVGGTINSFKNLKGAISGEAEKREQEEAAVTYDALAKKLQAKFGWTVMPREALAAHPEYVKLVQAQSAWDAVGNRRLPDILSEKAARGLTPDAREALRQALGVDGVVTVMVHYTLGKRGGANIGGFGKLVHHPAAQLDLALYDSGAEPVWADGGAKGDAAPTGVEEVNGVVVYEKEKQALEEAVGLALEAMTARFDDAKAKASAAQ